MKAMGSSNTVRAPIANLAGHAPRNGHENDSATRVTVKP
jgi:hypothetical protein